MSWGLVPLGGVEEETLVCVPLVGYVVVIAPNSRLSCSLYEMVVGFGGRTVAIWGAGCYRLFLADDVLEVWVVYR